MLPNMDKILSCIVALRKLHPEASEQELTTLLYERAREDASLCEAMAEFIVRCEGGFSAPH
jgi:hypothetical protein